MTASGYENGVEVPYFSMDVIQGMPCEEQPRTLGLSSFERGRLRGPSMRVARQGRGSQVGSSGVSMSWRHLDNALPNVL